MSLAEISQLGPANPPSQQILKKLQLAIKQVTREHGSDNNASVLTQEELIHLVHAWEPKHDIICLYVRWARQLRRNFNLDSIATLLSLSRQCNYTPVNFLRKVKILRMHKNLKSDFGLTFHFEIPTREVIDSDRLNKEFLGLSFTLLLLQEQITTSSSILGKTGMRQKGPRTAYQMGLPMEGHIPEQNATVVAHPTIEFHTQNSLLNRIWQSINHRWLALYLTEHLFREKEQQVSWSYHNALVYSFQMMAPCGPGRFEYLSPLVGYCLRYPTQASIEINRKQFQRIWQEPSSFLTYGNTCLAQFSNEAKSQIIVSCFQHLQSEFPRTVRTISYHRDATWQRRWTILRAYIFHFWLESSCNKSISSLVIDTFKAESGTKSGKRKRSDGSIMDVTPVTKATHQSMPDSTEPTNLPADPKTFESIMLSRRPPKEHPSTASTRNQRFPSVGPSSGSISLDDVEWMDLRLISFEEMDCFTKSYLLIHRSDGVNILS